MTDWDWDRIVVDHVHLRTADLAASLDFYGALMAALDIPALWRDETGTQWANLVVTAGERTTRDSTWPSWHERALRWTPFT
jgi:catechol 2,3-dioxygenase-like lactoylglutathione lyase family enzyme